MGSEMCIRDSPEKERTACPAAHGGVPAEGARSGIRSYSERTVKHFFFSCPYSYVRMIPGTYVESMGFPFSRVSSRGQGAFG